MIVGQCKQDRCVNKLDLGVMLVGGALCRDTHVVNNIAGLAICADYKISSMSIKNPSEKSS